MNTSGADRRSIAASLVRACREAGATHAFGVPGGGSNLDVVGEVVDQGMEFVLTHTETAAAIMAAVSAQLTGAPSLAVATRGPGMASAVNGVAQALLDHQPLVMVTDCVSAADRDRVSHQRLEQQGLMGPITKASVVLNGRDADAAPQLIAIALGGRPGPVHIDIDPDATGSDTEVPADSTASSTTGNHEIEVMLDRVAQAQRPVLIIGSGAVIGGPDHRAGVAAALARLGAATHSPMLCTYQARGMVADSDPWCGGIATAATIERPLLDEADLVIGIGLDPVEFIPAPWPEHLDVLLIGTWAIDDSRFFDDRLRGEAIIEPTRLADIIDVITERLDTRWAPGTGAAHRERSEAEVRAAVTTGSATAATAGLTPQQVIDLTAAAAPDECVVTVDAGAHMLVAMVLWPTRTPCSVLISSGLATMGYALPAAIAAGLVHRDRRIVCFTGDGGLGMVLAELETLARLGLKVTVVVLDDASLSLIAAKQAPDGQGGAAATDYATLDFAAVARACSIPAVRVGTVDEYRTAIADGFAHDGPMLIDVIVDPSAYGDILDAIRGPRRSSG